MHNSDQNKQQSRSQPYFQYIVNPGKKYQCLTCKKDPSSFTYLLSNNGIYCIPCFAKLKKWPSYYHVINKLEFGVLEQQWSALEEIYLFQGLEKHGFGNWNQISEYIETNKTKQDVQKHYTQYYLNSPSFIPQQSRLLSRRNSQGTLKQKTKQQKNRQTLTSKRIQSINLQRTISKKSQIQIVGYMPLRNDYEYQYDNEAELWLAEMQFNQEDTAQQKQMKFKIIQLYNSKLDQRNKKKEFVLSRGILDLEKQIQIEKTVPKNQKQIYNMMKIFSRFHSANDHQQLVKGIIKEKQLRQKIQQYKQLHRRGYRTRAQVQQQIQRKNQTTKTKKKSSNQYNFPISNFDPSRNNRRTNHHSTNVDSILKKPSVYLTPAQVELLRINKLSTITYMMIKETILRQNAKMGFIDRESVIPIFNLEKYVVNNVIDYLVSSQEIVCSQ